MGMPLPVVQHAMSRDGLDPSVMEGDHNLPEKRCMPLQDDPTYSKYFKMLKLGLPMGVVKNAMESVGIDPYIMDGDHNALVSSSRTASSSINIKQKGTHRRTRLHWDILAAIPAEQMKIVQSSPQRHSTSLQVSNNQTGHVTIYNYGMPIICNVDDIGAQD
jgi:hypothetical protein